MGIHEDYNGISPLFSITLTISISFPGCSSELSLGHLRNHPEEHEVCDMQDGGEKPVFTHIDFMRICVHVYLCAVCVCVCELDNNLVYYSWPRTSLAQ